MGLDQLLESIGGASGGNAPNGGGGKSIWGSIIGALVQGGLGAYSADRQAAYQERLNRQNQEYTSNENQLARDFERQMLEMKLAAAGGGGGGGGGGGALAAEQLRQKKITDLAATLLSAASTRQSAVDNLIANIQRPILR